MDLHGRFAADMAFLTKHNSLEYLNYAIHVSMQKRYIYFETPKVACSTLKRYLIRNESPDIDPWPTSNLTLAEFALTHDRAFSPLLSPQQVYPFSEKVRNGKYFRFCFVRNPYARILSAYLDQVSPNYSPAEAILAELGLPPDSPFPVPFETFIDIICRSEPAQMNPHWRTQFYATCQDVIEYDFIGKLETFDRDIDIVSVCAGLDMSLLETFAPHTTASDARIKDFYTPRLKNKVYDAFEVSFRKLGYAA